MCESLRKAEAALTRELAPDPTEAPVCVMWKFAAVGKKAVLVAGGAAVAAYSTYEWRQAKEKLAGGGALTEETLDRIFADIDKDGCIDEEEFWRIQRKG